MSWTPERERKLKELWKKGHTASQIASLIGNTTRNAVIGKAHRLNLEARAISKRSTSKVNTENNVKPETKIQKHGRKARFKALLLDKSFEQENPWKSLLIVNYMSFMLSSLRMLRKKIKLPRKIFLNLLKRKLNLPNGVSSLNLFLDLHDPQQLHGICF